MTFNNLSFDKKEIRPWTNRPMSHGTLVGHITPDSCKIWVKVRQAASYTLELSETADFSTLLPASISNNPLQISKDTLLTGVFNVTGLSPASHYFYRVRCDSQADDGQIVSNVVLGHQLSRSFRTPDNTTPLSFALYSCHMPFKWRGFRKTVSVSSAIDCFEYLNDFHQRQPFDFAIAAGDQVYTDGEKNVNIWDFLQRHKKQLLELPEAAQKQVMLSWYNDIYEGYWGFPELQKFHSQVPHYMLWDDHEIMDGWGSLSAEQLECKLEDGFYESAIERAENRTLMYRMFDCASEAYFYYQHSHNPDTNVSASMVQDTTTVPDRDWHFDTSHKNAAFFYMDVRGQKSHDEQAPNWQNQITLAGNRQITHLEQFLNSNAAQQADVLFIVSPVPFVHWKAFVMNIGDLINGVQDDVRDEWDHENNAEERDKILDLVFDYAHQHHKKVVILSGDVHSSGLFRIHRKTNNAEVFQYTSSAITYTKLGPAKLIKAAAATSGQLTQSDQFSYKRLSDVETRNNFSRITVEQQSVHFDLHAYDDDQLITHKRISI